MPLILVLSILFSMTFKDHFYYSIKKKILYIIFLFLFMGYVTANLTLTHKQPTAICQVSQYLKNKEHSNTIISLPLINYYLKSQNINAQFIDVEDGLGKIKLNSISNNDSIFIIGDLAKIIKGYSIIPDTSFFHNPYVNRMWSNINIYSARRF